MTFKVRKSGLDNANLAVNVAYRSVGVESSKMLTEMLMAVSANTRPYVPVDTSALINSEYREITEQGGKHHAVIGYGAPNGTVARGTPVQEYAVYVHEGPQKNWQKPGASNEYLVKGVKDFLSSDFESILRRYKPE